MTAADGSLYSSRRVLRVSVEKLLKGTLDIMSWLWARYNATMGDCIGVCHRTEPLCRSRVNKFPEALSVKCTRSERRNVTLGSGV